MFKSLVLQRTNLLSGAIANLDVISASINEDLTQKATSKIVCTNIPSSISQYDILRLYDSKGKFVYWGIVNGISGNEIKCSQFQSLFNDNFLLKKASNSEKELYATITISELLADILSLRKDGFVSSQLDLLDRDVANNYKGIVISAKDSGVERYPYPIENRVINLETFIYDMFNQYNRIIVPSFANAELLKLATDDRKDILTDSSKQILIKKQIGINQQHINILCCEPNGKVNLTDGQSLDFDYRVLFTTYENINNVSIVKQDEDTNTVYIYDKDGVNLRGAFTVDTSGTLKQIVTDVSMLGRIGTNKTKYIFDSDNDVYELARSELPTNQYNHKITFDITFNENNKFDNYILGQKIKYYDNATNRLFDTILTARKFEIAENSDTIKNATFTLGKVRQTLTSALNKRR